MLLLIAGMAPTDRCYGPMGSYTRLVMLVVGRVFLGGSVALTCVLEP